MWTIDRPVRRLRSRGRRNLLQQMGPRVFSTPGPLGRRAQREQQFEFEPGVRDQRLVSERRPCAQHRVDAQIGDDRSRPLSFVRGTPRGGRHAFGRVPRAAPRRAEQVPGWKRSWGDSSSRGRFRAPQCDRALVAAGRWSTGATGTFGICGRICLSNLRRPSETREASWVREFMALPWATAVGPFRRPSGPGMNGRSRRTQAGRGRGPR